MSWFARFPLSPLGTEIIFAIEWEAVNGGVFVTEIEVLSVVLSSVFLYL